MAFYTGVDQERYDAGNKFLPMNQFLLNYTAPTTNVEEEENVITSYGIPNTNAFVNSGDGPGQAPLGLTYDPRAVADTQAASVNKPFQTYTSLSSNRGPEIVMENLQKFEDQDLIDKAREYNPGKYDKFTDREMFDLGIKVGNHPLDNPTYETTVIPGHPNIFEGNVKTLEDEDDKGWFSSLFSRTPKVRGTLGTRLANAPRIPLPSAMASWSFSPFNPKSRNYNPRFKHQLNMLEMQNNMIGIDPNTGLHKYGPDSVLSGKNVISLFGSNDYEEALEKQKAWFENRINRGKKISWTNYQKLIKEEKKLEDKQKDIDDKDKAVAKTIRPQHHGDVSGGGVGGKGGQGDYTTPSLHQAPKEHTAPSKTGHMGPGGIHYAQGGRVYLNLGGLASIL